MPEAFGGGSFLVRVTVLLFAAARQATGRGSIELDLPEPASVGDLKRALAGAIPALAPMMPATRIAVDRAYADDDDPVGPDSELAAIPPVSGGSSGVLIPRCEP